VKARPLVIAALLTALAAPAAQARHKHRHRDTPRTLADLGSASVAVDTGAAIDGSRAKAIESYRLFLDLASKDPRLEAEAMRRLADLQLDRDDAAELERNVKSLGVGRGSAINLYERLLAAYPHYRKNDLVLYQLARAYDEDGQTKRALATLDRLIREYPHTPYYTEASFRRGETLFVEQRYAEAQDAYEKVLAAGPSSEFAEQAEYKLGWALFKQMRYRQSLKPFFALLDRAFRVAPAGKPAASAADPSKLYAAMNRADQELVDDTFRVLSISFSYLDGPKTVSAYFKSTGTRPYTYLVYRKLGNLYLDKQRYQDAAGAYRAFVALEPDDARAPLMLVDVIEAYKRAGFTDLVLGAKRQFVEQYGPHSPYWSEYSHAEQPRVAAALKANLSDLAAYHHAAAQTAHKPAEYAAAAHWYRTYLEAFPNDAAAPDKNFLLAEVLFESGDYAAAVHEYEHTAYGYPRHAHSAEAGYAALLAYAKQEKRLSGAALAQWHRRGIDSALRFANTYPEHEQAAAVLTNAAKQLYALKDLARARDVARQVVVRQPPADKKLRRTALEIVANAEFDLHDFAAAETAYADLRGKIPADDPEQKDIAEHIASAVYEQGAQARDAGDTKAAVDDFLRVGRVAPNSDVRPTADYDAATVLIKTGQWQRAIAVLEGFRARYPHHKLSADVTADLAVAYTKTGDNVHAAAEFEHIADGKGTQAEKREALWRAAELYRKSGRSAAAAGAFGRYVERYPAPAGQRIEAMQALADLAEAGGDEATRHKWLRRIVAADASAGAGRSDRTRYLAAEAQLALAAPLRDAYRAVRLVIPLKKSLEKKRALLKKALDAYGKAADYGVVDVTTAATYETAELYDALSRALYDSQRPAGLGKDELAQYNVLLEEQAYPFEEKAIQIHEVNAARTVKGVYDQWVAKSFAALAKLLPARYAKEEIGADSVGSFY
jgi:TolA-binding protein